MNDDEGSSSQLNVHGAMVGTAVDGGTVNAQNNTRTGVRVLTDSVVTLVNQARVVSTQNGTLGFVADNGSGVTLVNSTITGNAAGDIALTFGTRADLRTLTFGTHACDGTVLVRGTSGITCP